MSFLKKTLRETDACIVIFPDWSSKRRTKPVFKTSKIYDPLYNKLDFCSIIRYVCGSDNSQDAISLIPQKHNWSATVFTGFTGTSTVFNLFLKIIANNHIMVFATCFQALKILRSIGQWIGLLFDFQICIRIWKIWRRYFIDPSKAQLKRESFFRDSLVRAPYATCYK